MVQEGQTQLGKYCQPFFVSGNLPGFLSLLKISLGDVPRALIICLPEFYSLQFGLFSQCVCWDVLKHIDIKVLIVQKAIFSDLLQYYVTNSHKLKSCFHISCQIMLSSLTLGGNLIQRRQIWPTVVMIQDQKNIFKAKALMFCSIIFPFSDSGSPWKRKIFLGASWACSSSSFFKPFPLSLKTSEFHLHGFL